MSDARERLEMIEARVDALSATLRQVLTTLVLRGVLNRADIPALLQETGAALQAAGAGPEGLAELRSIRDDLPASLRAAAGPTPDPDDDDH